MDIKDYKSGTYEQQYEYESFIPTKVYIQWKVEEPELVDLLGEANRLIGSLDAYSDLVPNVDFFIKMHITKEATTSSKIEGTQTSFEEAFIDETLVDPERRDDWQEVNNYIRAINFAIKELESLPISERLIKRVHAILLEGARGKQKLPGQFRKSQNWIGSNLNQAVFIPPIHTKVPALMSDLERLINAEALDDKIVVPHLIRIAIIHYQFETIHPFLDGNGRIGRLLITLYLMDKNILKKPTLYLSEYFEKNRRDYYDMLTAVRKRNELTEWVKFFLHGVIETSKNSIEAFKGIIQLRQHIEFEVLPKLGRRHQYAQVLINSMYGQPVMTGHQIAKVIERHPSTANRLINELIKLDILVELTGFNRNRIFAFKPYIALFNM